MATESPMRMVESCRGTKWTSSKDAATFGSPLQSMAAEELGLVMKEHVSHRNQAPNRSGSAPPSMEGSFASIRNLLIEQNVSMNSSLDDLRNNTLKNFGFNEQQRPDPAYLACYFSNMGLKENRHQVHQISSLRSNRRSTSMDDSGNGFLHFSQGSLSTHKEESEEESSPGKDAEKLVANSTTAMPGKNTGFLASRHKSLVDLIQEDFPRTPSPVYNQSHSSGHATADELIDFNVHAISSNISSFEKTPEPSSGSINCPEMSSRPSSTSFPSSWHPDETGKLQKDESSNNLEVNAPISGAIRANTSRLEIKQNQEKPPSCGRNLSKLHLPRQEGITRQVHDIQGQRISQGINYSASSMERLSHGHPNFSSIGVQPSLQLPGSTPPFYPTAAAYMPSGNIPFYPNLQQSSLYAPQYSLPGYAPSSTLLPPFMAGYPFQNALPLPFGATYSPSFTGRIAGVSMGEGILHGADVQPHRKFYAQHEPIPQPSFVNPLHMQYYPNPSHEIYGSSVQHGQLARGIIGSQFTQQASTFSAYVGDHKFQSLTNEGRSVSAPRKMGIGGYGNPPFMSGVTQFPASPLASPLMPSSPIGGANHLGRQTETRFPQGPIRNPGIYSGSQVKRVSNSTDDLNKLSFLEELKSSNSKRLELSDIEGRIFEFSIDQHGSRFIQQKLEHCSAEEKDSVFKEVIPHASRLMTDVFGNYVIQKFFEHGSAEQRKGFADQLSGQILPLSLQMYGCRVIQKALEVIEHDQKALLAQELDGHVMKCVHDQNGNHVIQKCIECVPPEKIGFIISSIEGQVATLATHPYGCRVIQRILEHCSDDSQCQCIIDEILESFCVLAQDQYGNYVTQHVLERGKPHQRSQIISMLVGRIVQMSQHKYASNVVEKCLEHGNTSEVEVLIEEILGQSEENDYLLTMMKDQFANYVVQKIFEKSNDRQREILLDRTRTHLHALRKYTYGKHIVARFEQLSGKEGQTSESEGA
ncbi:pumilio homolog 5 isoform X1 [Morus notabilis]|uniref:pumilio homolog 5 isoform X1 n=1 Tax=Morus notabilis TaxID=981085 RepID=UPI000CED161C|nr:pumilio homolog 5 isoform X1 [Morus notabilis]XP_024019312.1 pumilio homolog 5 isoform X1 [Morus notabilis]